MEDVVGVILRGVRGVRVRVEAAIDDGGRCVRLHFTDLLASVLWGCWRCLCGNVSHRAVERGVHEFNIVLVEDFFRYYGLVFHLLGERALEEAELNGEKRCEEDGGYYCDAGARI